MPLAESTLTHVEHRKAPDDPDLPPALRDVAYNAVVVDASPEAREEFVRRTLERFCPRGHESTARPGDTCDRCGLVVPHPPPPTPAELVTQNLCGSRGCTKPNPAGACERCGRRLGAPHPHRG